MTNINIHYVQRRLPQTGVQIYVQHPEATDCQELWEGPLDADVASCLRILPPSVHALLLTRTPLWINACRYENETNERDNANDTGNSQSLTTRNQQQQQQQQRLTHLITHHSRDWLLAQGDTPAKAGGLEVFSIMDYVQNMRWHWNGDGGLLLHEYCHKIHQHCLPGGLQNRTIVAAYQNADRRGIYESVFRRDWAGKAQQYDLAYAMVDPKEFFAECSVAYWARGYPALDHYPSTALAASPPIRHPNVIQRLEENQQQQSAAVTEITMRSTTTEQSPLITTTTTTYPRSSPDERGWRKYYDCCCCCCCYKGWWWWLRLRRNRNYFCGREAHCNKFYPFTQGQLYVHDPDTYDCIDRLWKEEIAEWKDPEELSVRRLPGPWGAVRQWWCVLLSKKKKRTTTAIKTRQSDNDDDDHHHHHKADTEETPIPNFPDTVCL